MNGHVQTIRDVTFPQEAVPLGSQQTPTLANLPLAAVQQAAGRQWVDPQRTGQEPPFLQSVVAMATAEARPWKH